MTTAAAATSIGSIDSTGTVYSTLRAPWAPVPASTVRSTTPGRRRRLDVDEVLVTTGPGQRADVPAGEVDELVLVEVAREREHPVAGVAEPVAPHALDTRRVERRELLRRRDVLQAHLVAVPLLVERDKAGDGGIARRVLDERPVRAGDVVERHLIDPRLGHEEMHELEQDFEVGRRGATGQALGVRADRSAHDDVGIGEVPVELDRSEVADAARRDDLAGEDGVDHIGIGEQRRPAEAAPAERHVAVGDVGDVVDHRRPVREHQAGRLEERPRGLRHRLRRRLDDRLRPRHQLRRGDLLLTARFQLTVAEHGDRGEQVGGGGQRFVGWSGDEDVRRRRRPSLAEPLGDEVGRDAVEDGGQHVERRRRVGDRRVR